MKVSSQVEELSARIEWYEEQGKSGEYPKALLNGFKGYLHLDRYAEYHKVPDGSLVGCWAYASSCRSLKNL